MKVYFDGSFQGHGKKQRPCRPLHFQRNFVWKGYHWRLLAPYVCGKGLVLDFAKQVPMEMLQKFYQKWENEIVRYLKAVRSRKPVPESNLQLLYENPMETEMWVDAWVNGRAINSISGSGCIYRPLRPKLAEGEETVLWEAVSSEAKEAVDAGSSAEAKEAVDAGSSAEAKEAVDAGSSAEAKEAVDAGSSAEAKEAVDVKAGTDADVLRKHYGLSAGSGWYFYRMWLKWDYKRIPSKLKVRLDLKPDKLNLPCSPGFETRTGEKGREVTFTHPLDGTAHTLVIEDVTQEKIPKHNLAFFQEEYLFPRNLQCLQYYLADSRDEGNFLVFDRQQGDAPIRKDGEQQSGATSVFLVGNVRKEEIEATEELAPETAQAASVPNGKEGGRPEEENPRRKYQGSRLCFGPVEHTKWEIDAVVVRGEEKKLEWDLLEGET